MTQKTILRISAIICAISGTIILIGVIYPIVSYNATYGKNFSELVSPVSENSGSSFINTAGSTKGSVLPNATNQPSDSTDFSKASNWFIGGAKPSDFNSSKIKFFTMSIPKLNIKDTSVAIGGEDLNKSLIQYPGTALPGRPGNTVIFGHSILPIFYNPKNYISIFSLLPTLKKGDEIDIDYDGISYQFTVENLFEVLPTDLQVLDQDPSDAFITLVTCVPPGDPSNPKRLIVRARVVPPTN